MAVAREITKLHEEFFRGRISGALEYYSANPPRGEITLVLAGSQPQVEIWSEEKILLTLKERKSQGSTPSQIASKMAIESGWPRREIYKLLINLE
jgi:16S rRNA (cytidine1402-2'-O)-methyltransferase